MRGYYRGVQEASNWYHREGAQARLQSAATSSGRSRRLREFDLEKIVGSDEAGRPTPNEVPPVDHRRAANDDEHIRGRRPGGRHTPDCKQRGRRGGEGQPSAANPLRRHRTGGQCAAAGGRAGSDHGILKTIASTLREIPEGLVKAGSGLAEWEADKVAQLMRFLGAPEGVVDAAESFRDQQWQPEQIEAASDKPVNTVLPKAAEGPVRDWTQHQPAEPCRGGDSRRHQFPARAVDQEPAGHVRATGAGPQGPDPRAGPGRGHRDGGAGNPADRPGIRERGAPADRHHLQPRARWKSADAAKAAAAGIVQRWRDGGVAAGGDSRLRQFAAEFRAGADGAR